MFTRNPAGPDHEASSQSSVIEVTVMMDSFWKTSVEYCEATRSICHFSARSTDLTFEALVRVGFSTRRGASLGGLETWFQAELLHRIALSAVETEEALKVKAEVPSFSEEKIAVSVEPRCLMIEGKRESKKEETRNKTVCAEGRSGQIFMELSAEVDSEKVTATLRNGVLDLTVLKVAKA